MERKRLALISYDNRKLQKPAGGGGGGGGVSACLRCFALTSMSRQFLQRRYDIRGGEENGSRHRCEERKNVRLLETT